MSTLDSRSAGRARPVPAWALALPVVVVMAATAVAAGVVTMRGATQGATVAAGPAKVGQRAPQFTASSPDGSRVSLAAYRGRPVALTFWATWCTACQQELPALQGLQDRYRSSRLTVLAVNYRETDTGRMSRFLAGLHVNPQVALDPQGAIAAAYGVDVGLPVTVWLDAAQTVDRIMVGAQLEPDLGAAAALVTRTAAPA